MRQWPYLLLLLNLPVKKKREKGIYSPLWEIQDWAIVGETFFLASLLLHNKATELWICRWWCPSVKRQKAKVAGDLWLKPYSNWVSSLLWHIARISFNRFFSASINDRGLSVMERYLGLLSQNVWLHQLRVRADTPIDTCRNQFSLSGLDKRWLRWITFKGDIMMRGYFKKRTEYISRTVLCLQVTRCLTC